MLLARQATAIRHLSKSERHCLAASARSAQRMERVWQQRFDYFLKELDEKIFAQLVERGQFLLDTNQIDFLPLLLDFTFAVTELGLASAETALRAGEMPVPKRVERPLTKMAGRKRRTWRIPRTLAELKELYDAYRKKKLVPVRQQRMAEEIKQAYIKRCQSVWEKYGKEFREGEVYSRGSVTRILRQKGDMARARANMIVQTETTYYYNNARRQVYDASSDVSHYLFVAIRDKATTKWCRTRQGLVYAKGDPLLKQETPPCHWNCRSEILPLTAYNPRHRQLIEDSSRARRNNRCEPLPKGWGGR